MNIAAYILFFTISFVILLFEFTVLLYH